MTQVDVIKPKKKYKTIPCKKCLMLPTCMAIYNDTKSGEYSPYFHYMSYDCMNDLITKCSSLDRYILENELREIDQTVIQYRSFYRIRKISEYFNSVRKRLEDEKI